jgi:hypothetical protein
MTTSLVYLILILHGTPFTQAMPFPDEATCQSQGDKLAMAVNTIDTQAKARAFCLIVPKDDAPDPLGAPPISEEPKL